MCHRVSGQAECGCKVHGAQVTHFALAQDLLSVLQLRRKEEQHTEASRRTIYRSLLAYLATGRR